MCLCIYRIIIQCYLLIVRLAALWRLDAKAWIEGRKKNTALIQSYIQQSPPPCVWMHVSSLGEFEQGRSIIESIRIQYPSIPLVVTFYSPSGFDVRKNYTGADLVCYLPIESKSNIQHWIDSIRPICCILVKYDYWFGYLHALNQKKIPIVLIAGLFKKKQIFFQPICGGAFRAFLKKFYLLHVQNAKSQELLTQYGIDSRVTGDPRIDRVIAIANTIWEDPILDSFCKNASMMVAGSTWPEDEAFLAHWWQHRSDHQLDKLILAPHTIEESHLLEIERKFPNAIRYSQSKDSKIPESSIMILDTLGQLAYIYRKAKIAYVGGGFGQGVHSILEPLAYKIPVICGPKHGHFPEVHLLSQLGGVFAMASDSKNANSETVFSADHVSYFTIPRAIEFQSLIEKNLQKEQQEHITTTINLFLQTHSGATSKILETLQPLLCNK